MIAEYRQLSVEDLNRLLKEDQDNIEEFLFEDGGEIEAAGFLSLDKSWHSLHFLLNGDPWQGSGPLFNAVLGGQEFGDDMGYGPPRYLSADQVKEVAQALSKVDRVQLKAKFDPQAFKKAEIYGFNAQDANSEFGYMMGYLQELTSFFESAAKAGKAVVISLT